MKIVLPWPAHALSPNARVPWRALWKAKKRARLDGANATYEAVNGGLSEARAAFAGDFGIPLTITFYPPDNRQRDLDNALASMKANLDGIADALAVNDRRFVPAFAFGDVVKLGRVEVLIDGRASLRGETGGDLVGLS